MWYGLAAIGTEAGLLRDTDLPRPAHLVSFGAGWAVAEKVHAAAGMLGFPKIDSIGCVAPAAGGILEKITNIRVKSWPLADPAPADVALPRFAGDWPDLFARLLPESLSRPRATSRNKMPTDLALACTSPSVLNLVLRNMLDRSPARTRRFV